MIKHRSRQCDVDNPSGTVQTSVFEQQSALAAWGLYELMHTSTELLSQAVSGLHLPEQCYTRWPLCVAIVSNQKLEPTLHALIIMRVVIAATKLTIGMIIITRNDNSDSYPCYKRLHQLTCLSIETAEEKQDQHSSGSGSPSSGVSGGLAGTLHSMTSTLRVSSPP